MSNYKSSVAAVIAVSALLLASCTNLARSSASKSTSKTPSSSTKKDSVSSTSTSTSPKTTSSTTSTTTDASTTTSIAKKSSTSTSEPTSTSTSTPAPTSTSTTTSTAPTSTSTPASTSTSTSAPTSTTTPTKSPPTTSPTNTVTVTNWAGYVDYGTSFKQVQGSWIQPSLTCTSSNSYSAYWVGFDGYNNSNSLEQIGTQANCLNNGVPSYSSWYEMYPSPLAPVGKVVKPGDVMFAKITYNGSMSFTLFLADQTQGWSYQITKSTSSVPKVNSAEWIVEAPLSNRHPLPLADFTPTSFTNSQATSLSGITGPINDPAWSNAQAIMYLGSGSFKAAPSSLASNGSSFDVTWYHN